MLDASLAPTRPAGVPEAAEFDYAEAAWLVRAWDEDGELHGALRAYRASGELDVELEYRHGKTHGPFRRYHPSGKLAQEGRYFDGFLDGLTVSYSAADESGSIRVCCIPDDTRMLKQEHRRGALLRETFFDAAGRGIQSGYAEDAYGEELREREGDVASLGYGFGPTLERIAVLTADETVVVEQPLSELRAAIERAAQRVLACRAALLRVAPERAPPDVAHCIAGGQELRQLDLAVAEDEPVQVDEVLPLAHLSPAALSWRAGLEWTALCWLCWAAGLDEPALPERVAPRPNLYAALVHASARVEALEAGSPAEAPNGGFHGLNETRLPGSALSRLAEHYREQRAVLLFATDPECVSPWQSDLGRST